MEINHPPIEQFTKCFMLQSLALKINRVPALIILIAFLSCKTTDQTKFDQLASASNWKLQMVDPCTGEWPEQWFMDGLLSSVENSDSGMNFKAGNINRDDAHHAVLWTKESFTGDVRIEYNYTRTDSQKINVNILYIQATGIGREPYHHDISKWNSLREIPAMSIYFKNMKALHISYAAFNMVNDDAAADYVRVRKYPVTEQVKFKDTEIPPAFYRTGLFLPGVKYRITIIKTDSRLFFKVNGGGVMKLYSWKLDDQQPILEGRIGLRHMFTRSAQYSDFKVFVRP
jgi:hypothetical protein